MIVNGHGWFYDWMGLSRMLFKQGKDKEAFSAVKEAYFGNSSTTDGSILDLIYFGEVAEKCQETELVPQIWDEMIRIVLDYHQRILTEACPKNPTRDQALALCFVRVANEYERQASLKVSGANADDDAIERRYLEAALARDPRCVLAHMGIARILQKNLTPAKQKSALSHWEKVKLFGWPSLKEAAAVPIRNLTWQVNHPLKTP